MQWNQLLYLQQKLTLIIAEAKTQVLWLAYDRWLQFSIHGASCDLGCSPWLFFRIGYKITITMNYLHSAFFCPPCQSFHDMYVCAFMYIYDICICICIYLCMSWWLQQAQFNHYQLLCQQKKWQKILQWSGKMVTVTALCRWLQFCLLLLKWRVCRLLRVVTVIDIICHCCCCFCCFSPSQKQWPYQ